MTEYYEAETREELAEAMQRRINNGTIWRLEGHAGRTAMGLIEEGLCMLGRDGYTDYWGNPIPSRDEVQEGTRGSFTFVADLHGRQYAERMAGLS